jgi:protein gp37
VAGLSDIEWTDATWNPVAGCTIISPGCTNCYAMRMAARLAAMEHPDYVGLTRKSGGRFVWTGKTRELDRTIEQPLRWSKARRIFVNSMSDLFQDGISDDHIRRVWMVMQQADWHQYQVLTKRPERMRAFLDRKDVPSLAHVWVGTSVESSDFKDRIKVLRSARAAVKFISFEPLIGGIGRVNLKGIDWAIVGGESGPRARPMEDAWVEELLSACKRDGVAFFFKQWGGTNKKKAGRTFKGRTWDEYPVELAASA